MAWLAILLGPAVGLAQVGPGPQIVPPAAESVPLPPANALPAPPPPGLPGPNSLAPAGEASWPPTAPSTLSPQPPAPPASWTPPPGQPVAQPAAVWVAPPPRAVFVPWSEPCIAPPAVPAGRWNVVLEALWLTRSTGSGAPLGYTSYNFDSHAHQAVPTRRLHTDDDLFPLQTGLRFQLGRRIGERRSSREPTGDCSTGRSAAPSAAIPWTRASWDSRPGCKGRTWWAASTTTWPTRTAATSTTSRSTSGSAWTPGVRSRNSPGCGASAISTCPTTSP